MTIMRNPVRLAALSFAARWLGGGQTAAQGATP